MNWIRAREKAKSIADADDPDCDISDLVSSGDTFKTGEFKDNIQIKSQIVSKHPYGEWIDRHRKDIKKSPDETTTFAQSTFGWGLEDIGMQIKDMAGSAKETTYSMGDDAPTAVFSERAK